MILRNRLQLLAYVHAVRSFARPNQSRAFPNPFFVSNRMTFAVSYGLSFGTLTATLVHTWCKFGTPLFILCICDTRALICLLFLLVWYRKDIMRQFRSSLREEPDVHARRVAVFVTP